MDKKLIRKQIRRSFNPVGWSLVIYNIIMNVAATAAIFADGMIREMKAVMSGQMIQPEELTESIMGNAWGYLLAAAIGLVILLCWKGKAFWKNEIWRKGKPMTAGVFFGALTVFIGCQLAASIGATILEAILNQFDLSAMTSVESASANADTLSMFLYMAICAPVTEEILFRGLIQRTMMPYGKRFAIVASAFLFGLFHGNLVQTPYAFLVGLVLGYVASEYSIAWAMLLHMINNMILGDSFNRLTSGLTENQTGLILTLITGGCAIAGVVILIRNRKKIAEDLGPRKIDGRCVGCFLSNAGIIVLTVMMIVNMAAMLFI